MEQFTSYFTSYPDEYFIVIIIIAFGMGVHGLTLLFKLNKYMPGGQQTDKLILAIFNILISLVSIFMVIIIMRVNTTAMLQHTAQQLTDLK